MQAFLAYPHHILLNASRDVTFLKRIPSLLDKSNQPVMFSSLWIKKHSLQASSPFGGYHEKYTHKGRHDSRGEKGELAVLSSAPRSLTCPNRRACWQPTKSMKQAHQAKLFPINHMLICHSRDHSNNTMLIYLKKWFGI